RQPRPPGLFIFGSLAGLSPEVDSASLRAAVARLARRARWRDPSEVGMTARLAPVMSNAPED
ncbi:MAG TPA: hypothetical protein VFQ53_00615, partial [Kofleriaceae bacterium]|nr:hypothetical protein [Kofleriaceae bacterium]